MKRQTFFLGAVAFLFLLQLAIVPAAVLANADAIQSTVSEAGWEGLPILAQPEGFEEEIERAFEQDPQFQGMTEEQKKAAIAAAGAAAGIGMAFVLVVILIALAIELLILYLFYGAASQIPEEHQKVSPVMVWLFVVPLVNIVMLFIVFPGIAKGFQSYFASQNRTDVGDCGASLAMWFIVSAFLCPPVNLVILIILLMKFRGLASEIA